MNKIQGTFPKKTVNIVTNDHNKTAEDNTIFAPYFDANHPPGICDIIYPT